jgi:tetratricopeptide (TPR) repeat protein
LTKALEETPGELRLLYGAALAAYEQGKDRVTIVHMTQALSVWDEGTSSGLAHGVLCDIHYHLGLAHANVGYYGNAIEWFTRAISDPKIDVEVKVNIIHERAKAHQMERMFTEAIDDFTAVIKYNPRNAHAHFRRGFAWKSMGQFEKAADDLETAKILDPSNPHLVVNYSQIHDTECVILCSAGEEKAYK